MDNKWEKLNLKIKTTQSSYVEPNYPFQPGHLISDFNVLYKKIYDKEKFVNMWKRSICVEFTHNFICFNTI